MRYFCKNCFTVFNFASGSKIPVEYLKKILEKQKEMGIKDKCCVCGSFLERIPYYEIPQQYKERTGERWEKNWLVWYRVEVVGKPYFSEWHIGFYKDAIEDAKCADEDGRIYEIVIADPPVPPPDDWRPE